MCLEMRPPQVHLPRRINLDDLKTQIVEKLGPEHSKQYFYYLNRFFNYKISKDEFNKVCLRVIGRDNIPLHNRLFQSIIKNAHASKIPPPPANMQLQVPKTSIAVGNRELQPDWNKKTEGSYPFGLPNGKTNNGFLKFELASERKKKKKKSSAWSLLKAPLGVPLWSHQTAVVSSRGFSLSPLSSSSSEIGVLLDSVGVKRRLEQIALTQGLEGGVSADCVYLLKTGLNVYLKNLISSSVHLNARTKTPMTRYMNGSNRVGLISMHDFRVAMELNPLQLGEDWPIQLERICNRSYDE